MVAGRPAVPGPSRALEVGASSQQIIFGFGGNTNHGPLRVRYRLEGFDTNWRESSGAMLVGVRFYDSSLAIIARRNFEVTGESPGWTGSFEDSPLVPRRETLDAPPRAALVSIEISSAGPPDTVGVFAVANLTLSGYTNQTVPSLLIRTPLDQPSIDETNARLLGWCQDGTRPSMATIIRIGTNPPAPAFAIKDDDLFGHAEWRAVGNLPQPVSPGEHLILEWKEAFSVGIGSYRRVAYQNLPPGHYLFRIMGLDLMGKPVGSETSVGLLVPSPVWQRPWFIGGSLGLAAFLVFAAVRYFEWRKIRIEMQRLKNLQAVEQERLRIAHDIHDDLGARVTQISLMSAMFHDKTDLPDEARSGFAEIKHLSQDLISSLYETVWTVTPEYDHLTAMGDYLCQMVDQLCERAQLRCRLRVMDLPSDVPVSSQIRHNLSLVVKEAVHNVIKHAQATELVLHIAFVERRLDIVVQDNGCGIPAKRSLSGNGLNNMNHRMMAIGGTFAVESNPGGGAIIRLSLSLPKNNNVNELSKSSDS